jgi:hypothetical protein
MQRPQCAPPALLRPLGPDAQARWWQLQQQQQQQQLLPGQASQKRRPCTTSARDSSPGARSAAVRISRPRVAQSCNRDRSDDNGSSSSNPVAVHSPSSGSVNVSVRMCNQAALQLLSQNRRDEALQLLMRARALLEPCMQHLDSAQATPPTPSLLPAPPPRALCLWLLTCNNLACWHRGSGDAESALRVLRSTVGCNGAAAHAGSGAPSARACSELLQQVAVTHR